LTTPQGGQLANGVPGTMGKPGLTATLWAINLASISASVLVYVYLAHYAYRELQSLLISEFVLFAPMVMPVVFAFQLNQVASRVDARTLFLAANIIGAAICAVLFVVLPMSSWTILAGAGIVGTLDAVQRVARIVAIKRYFSPQELKFTVPLTLTAQFIAGAIAGSIVAFFPGQITNAGAAATTITLMGIATACACLLPKSPLETTHARSGKLGLADCLSLLRKVPALRDSLLAFVILGTFFQGFYSISRVALPAHHLGLGQMQVGILQIVASLSAVTGALLYYFLSRRKVAFKLPYLYAACALAMLSSCIVPDARLSFASYFVYFFFFELAFFRLQGDIMAATQASDMPLVATVQYALVYAGMMLAIAVGALLVDQLGLLPTAIVFVLGFYVASALQLALRAPASQTSPHGS
jgi:hypothetical protein